MRPRRITRSPRETRGSPRMKGEHLIFVKNVPQYIVQGNIPALFAPYRPNRIKNIYPDSANTTLVIGFDDAESAWRAQSETNGRRLVNVILRVEGFERERSMAFIRKKEMGAVDEEYGDEYRDDYGENCEEDEGGYEEQEVPMTAKSVEFPPLKDSNRKSAVVGTWAQKIEGLKADRKREEVTMLSRKLILQSPTTGAFAKNGINAVKESKHQLERESKDALLVPEYPRSEVKGPGAPTEETVVPEMQAHAHAASIVEDKPVEHCKASFQEADDQAEQQQVLDPPNTIYNVVDHEQENRQPQATPQRDSIFSPWHSLDTTANIRQRHVRNCVFCNPYIHYAYH